MDAFCPFPGAWRSIFATAEIPLVGVCVLSKGRFDTASSVTFAIKEVFDGAFNEDSLFRGCVGELSLGCQKLIKSPNFEVANSREGSLKPLGS